MNQEITRKIKKRVFSESHSAKIALFGLGGVGKTQIVLETVYQIREIYPDCSIFWLSAVDMESLHQAYLKMAYELGIDTSDPNGEDVKILVQKHLSQPASGRWLLIFDNADDHDMWIGGKNPGSETLKDFLPVSDQGAIVFTTRSHRIAHHLSPGEIIEITEMNEEKATQLLRNNLIKKELLNDTDGTRKLLDRLTHLPLAIVQAACFMNENFTSVQGYLKLIDGQEQTVIDLLSADFEDEGRYKSIRNPVATTWLTSFFQIQQKYPLASEYMSLMCCMTGQDIPIFLLRGDDALEREKAIGILVSYSFIRVREAEETVSMHRLVHLATRNWLGSANVLHSWESAVLRHIYKSYPRGDESLRNVWRSTVPHALHILELTANGEPTATRGLLLKVVGQCHIDDGRYKEAVKLFKEASAIAEIVYGPESDTCAHLLYGLARGYRMQGKTEKATVPTKRLAEITMKIYGPGHLETSRANVEVACLHWNKGEILEAQELWTNATKNYLKQLGPRNLESIHVAGLVVGTYNQQGRISDAGELALQVLQMSKATFGIDHLQTAFDMCNLAHTYIQLWRLKEAEELYRTAFETNKRLAGPEHPYTVATMSYLANAWALQGLQKQAIAMMTEYAQLMNQSHGPDYPATRWAFDTLKEWNSSRQVTLSAISAVRELLNENLLIVT